MMIEYFLVLRSGKKSLKPPGFPTPVLTQYPNEHMHPDGKYMVLRLPPSCPHYLMNFVSPLSDYKLRLLWRRTRPAKRTF